MRGLARVDDPGCSARLAASAMAAAALAARRCYCSAMRIFTLGRLVKVVVIAVIGAAVLVISPWWKPTPQPFEFQAPEVLAAVEGTWQLHIAPAAGPARTIRFTLAQRGPVKQPHASRGLIRAAAACEHRSFVKAASACLQTTEVPLELVWLTETGPHREEPALFVVEGTRFRRGHVKATIGELKFVAQIMPDGTAGELRLLGADERSSATSTLVRTAR